MAVQDSPADIESPRPQEEYDEIVSLDETVGLGYDSGPDYEKRHTNGTNTGQNKDDDYEDITQAINYSIGYARENRRRQNDLKNLLNDSGRIRDETAIVQQIDQQVTACFDDMDSQMDGFQETADEIDDEISDLHGDVEALESSIREVDNRTNNRIRSIQQEVSGIQQSIVDYFVWPFSVGFAILATGGVLVSGYYGSFVILPAILLSALFWLAVIQLRRNSVEDPSL